MIHYDTSIIINLILDVLIHSSLIDNPDLFKALLIQRELNHVQLDFSLKLLLFLHLYELIELLFHSNLSFLFLSKCLFLMFGIRLIFLFDLLSLYHLCEVLFLLDLTRSIHHLH